MIWSDFVDAVDSHLAVEANRRGLEAFRTRYIRNAVLDLQRYIRGYRTANGTVYQASDLETQGKSQLATLPTGAKPKALWMYQALDLDEGASAQCCRNRLEFYPWNNRQDLICGSLSFAAYAACCVSGTCPATPVTAEDLANWQSKAYVYTMSPMARNILIYPQVTTSTRLLLVWDGLKITFADGDDVPYPLEAAEAVAEYILWKIRTVIDKDPVLAKLHYDTYRAKRLELFRDFRESGDDLADDPKDEEYQSTDVTPTPQLDAFGAQNVIFLRNVTALAGTTTAALANVPTLNLSVPFMVEIKISGVTQTWVLQSGTAATAIGVHRPNDYASGTNEKIWVQLS